jgi:uncharacterized protein (TIGR02996 family)
VTAIAIRDPGFEAALEAAPEDQGVRLVYADFVEERGDEAYGRALRWLAGRDLCPTKYGERWYFGTIENEGWRTGVWRASALPVWLYRRLQALTPRYDFPDNTGSHGYWCLYRTVQQVTEYLARALTEGEAPE